MKKLFIILLASIAVLSAQAQKKRKPFTNKTRCTNPVQARSGKSSIYTYEYKFDSMKKSNDCNIMPRHKKDLVYINISNINRMVYDIEAHGTFQSLPLERINLFDTLANALKTSAISPATKAVDAPPAATNTKMVANGKSKKTKKILYKKVIEATPYYAEKKAISGNQTYIMNHFASWVDDLKKLESFLRYGKNVTGLIGAECCSQDKLKASLITEPNVMQFDPGIYNPRVPVNVAIDYPKLMSSVNTTPGNLVNSIKRELEQMKKAKQKADELIADIKKDCKKNKKQDPPECNVDELEDNYPDDFAKAVAEAEKVDASKIADATSELNIVLHKIDNKKNFEYQMLSPFAIEGDTYQAKVMLKPKQAFASYAYADSIINPYLVRGKFEWAIGPGLNFHISKSLIDESFQIDSSRNALGVAKTDTFTIIKNINRSRMVPSIGIMAHFYWQQHAAFTPGIVLGIATSPAELKDLRAYLGFSLMAGGLSDKIFFNTGFAFGWSNRLKANLKTGENIKSQIPFTGDKIASPDQLVERTFHTGWFFGVTYKLSN